MEAAAQRGEAPAEIHQADAVAGGSQEGGVEAAPVVFEQEGDAAGRGGDIDKDPGGFGVSEDIGKTFLEGAVEHGQEGRGSVAGQVELDEVDFQAAAQVHAIDEPFHGLREVLVLPFRGMELVGDAADLVEGEAGQLATAAQASQDLGVGGAELALDQIKIQENACERLSGVVVQLAGDTAPLALDGLEEIEAGAAQETLASGAALVGFQASPGARQIQVARVATTIDPPEGVMELAEAIQAALVGDSAEPEPLLAQGETFHGRQAGTRPQDFQNAGGGPE